MKNENIGDNKLVAAVFHTVLSRRRLAVLITVGVAFYKRVNGSLIQNGKW